MWKAGSSAWLYLLSRASLDLETLQPKPKTFWHSRELHVFGNTNSWTTNLSTRPLSLFLDLKSQQGRDKMRKILKTFTKVILVRHPLTRLVSAFKDKFRHGNDGLYQAMGCSIVKMARSNQSLNVEGDQKKRCQPTLEEFFIYLNKTTKPDFIFDAHWTMYQTLALPCWIDYDIIMKVENWYPEIGYCFNKIHQKPVTGIGKEKRRYDEQIFNGEDFQKRFHDRAGDESHEKYINATRQLPEILVKDVRKLFQLDFEAFNYE